MAQFIPSHAKVYPSRLPFFYLPFLVSACQHNDTLLLSSPSKHIRPEKGINLLLIQAVERGLFFFLIPRAALPETFQPP